LEEVIVTAQKRSERVEDVPLSLSVLTGDDISRRGLVNAEDYLRGLPGVNQQADLYGGTIVIRGIETHPSFQNSFTGATVGTYFGETPTTSTAGLLGGSNVDTKLVDIERVEVLRGPQGTAFGDASLGGTVRVIPAAPKLDRFEGTVSAGYSATSGFGGSNYTTQGIVNIPLIDDKLAIRAVAYRFENSGYYRNIAASDPTFQSTVVVPNGSQAFAVDVPRVGDFEASGARVAALFKPTDDLKFTLSYLSQTTETDGIPVATVGTFEQAVLQVPSALVERGQRGGLADSKIRIANAVMEYDLHWADLLASYSDINSGSLTQTSYTAYTAGLPLAAVYDSSHREHVGELRIATKLDGAWNALAGLYADKHLDDSVAPYYWGGDPATNPFGPGIVGVVGNRPEIDDVKQRAAFGEVSWKFLPGFTLTGGARAYHYDTSAHFDKIGFFGSGTDFREVAASGATYRGNLSYKLGDALLYASWSQGFRLGRAQEPVPASFCDKNGDGIVDGTTNITIDSTGRVTSDHVTNYELGAKMSLFDRRVTMDAAVFQIDWTNIPIAFAAPPAPKGCGIGYTANAGDARSNGVEFQTSWLATDAFRIDAGGSWTNARLVIAAPAIDAAAGARLPGSSKVNANLSLQYSFDVIGLPANVRADSIYVGHLFTTLAEAPNSEAGGYLKLDLSGRLVIKNLDLDLFVHNVTNNDAFTLRDPFTGSGNPFYGYRLQPRTIGINATAHF
jgi:iron complex outermembrane recepter protein